MSSYLAEARSNEHGWSADPLSLSRRAGEPDEHEKKAGDEMPRFGAQRRKQSPEILGARLRPKPYLAGVVAYFRRNLSTRPAVSIIFCLPV